MASLESVTSALAMEKAASWTRCELRGYGSQPVPAYRIVRGALIAEDALWGPQPLASDRPEVEAFSRVQFRQPISEIEMDVDAIPRERVTAFIVSLSPEGEADFRTRLHTQSRPGLMIAPEWFQRILSVVRSTAADLLAALLEVGVAGDDGVFTAAEAERARSLGDLPALQANTCEIPHIGSIRRRRADGSDTFSFLFSLQERLNASLRLLPANFTEQLRAQAEFERHDPDATPNRGRAIELARTDTAAALQMARGIRSPWFCCQALAGVAEYLSVIECEQVIDESLAAAAQDEDRYQLVGASAWPLQVLLKRGLASQFDRVFPRLLARSREVTPQSSRSQALHLYLSMFWPFGRARWLPVVEELIRASFPMEHWRTKRNYRIALLQVAREDLALARQMADRVTDEKLRTRIERELVALKSRGEGG